VHNAQAKKLDGDVYFGAKNSAVRTHVDSVRQEPACVSRWQ